MFRLLILDALFGAAVLLQTVAALNVFRLIWKWPLRAEFEPVLAFYQANITPVTSFPVRYIFAASRNWYADAYLISVVLGFLFFIVQARRAIAPHETTGATDLFENKRERVEGAIDAVFAFGVAAIAAMILSFPLLPLATPLIAFWVLGIKVMGKPSWFAVSASYYWNLLLVTGLTAAALSLPR